MVPIGAPSTAMVDDKMAVHMHPCDSKCAICMPRYAKKRVCTCVWVFLYGDAQHGEVWSLPGCYHKTSLNTLLQCCIAAERGNRVFLDSPIQIRARQTTLLV